MSEFSHSAGDVVLNMRGEVLVISQRDKSWSLPKGKIKQGENPRTAAVREIAEESGVTDLTFIRILKSYSRYTMTNTGQEDPQRLKRITMYLFTTQQEDLHPMDPRIPDAKWVEKSDVAAMLTHPKDQEFFLSVLLGLETIHLRSQRHSNAV